MMELGLVMVTKKGKIVFVLTLTLNPFKYQHLNKFSCLGGRFSKFCSKKNLFLIKT